MAARSRRKKNASSAKPQRCHKRIKKELSRLNNNPIHGITACLVKENNYCNWNATIAGPEDSPYDGGIFKLKITFPPEYPLKPPTVVFKTKIYHCNINESGQICLDILKTEWSPVLTISKVLLSIISLLTDPNESDPLVSSVAQLYKRDRDQHDENARTWTQRYASVN